MTQTPETNSLSKTCSPPEKRSLIVVIGAGRSGTSLTMQVLQALGMDTSEELLGELDSNPLGHIEDAEVYRIHATLMKELQIEHNLMLPRSFMQDPHMHTAKEELKKIILKNVNNARAIWGVKDPRIALFLPMWIQIFQELKLKPKYILCVRTPSHVIASTQKYYKWLPGFSEVFWLVRNIYSLFYTRAHVFIAHYEDWISNHQEMSKNLAQYTGLDAYFENGVCPDTSTCIHPDLNRSSKVDMVVQNIMISKLYTMLIKCRQAHFDQKALLQITEECFAYLNACRPWSENIIVKNTFMKQTLKDLEACQKELEKYKETFGQLNK